MASSIAALSLPIAMILFVFVCNLFTCVLEKEGKKKDTVGLNVHPLQPQIMLQSKPAAHTPPLRLSHMGVNWKCLAARKEES